MRYTFEKLNHPNPVFINSTTIGKEGKSFILKGKGKVIQISFLSNELHTSVKHKVDGADWNTINNGYCLSSISDTRGLGYANIERLEDGFLRYTFTLPIYFDEEAEICVFNPQTNAKLKDLHIYYLKCKE